MRFCVTYLPENSSHSEIKTAKIKAAKGCGWQEPAKEKASARSSDRAFVNVIDRREYA